jgi:creatinine amidohydrolase
MRIGARPSAVTAAVASTTAANRISAVARITAVARVASVGARSIPTAAVVALAAACAAAPGGVDSATKTAGIRLADLTWIQAEKVLSADTIVVLPIGAAAKEHGPHLRLSNDWVLAEYFARRVCETEPVVIAPTVTYSFYPAFLEYPGSTSLSLETARDVVVEICESLARYGPKRFYALNTGISTVRALEPAAEKLAAEGILLRFTDLKSLEPVEWEVCTQTAGSHADESETSMLLYIDPSRVDMGKAVKDCGEKKPGPLTRDRNGKGTYSPTGIFGDPTLATREKGEKLCEALVRICSADIQALREMPLPAAAVRSSPAQ